MALQLGLLHEALKAAGVSDELARGAAEEAAAFESQLAGRRADIVSMRGSIEALRAYVEGRFSLLNWMVGTIGALVLAILVKLFVHG